MNRPQVAVVAMLIGGGIILLAMFSHGAPSKDLVQRAFAEAQANGLAHRDADMYTVWSVKGSDGHAWTCKVHIDDVANPDFVADGFYSCSDLP